MSIKPSINLDALFTETQAQATAGQSGLEFKHRIQFAKTSQTDYSGVWSDVHTQNTGAATVFDVSALSFQGSTKDLETGKNVRFFSVKVTGGTGTGTVKFFNSTTELAKVDIQNGVVAIMACENGDLFGAVLNTFEVEVDGAESLDVELILAVK